MDPAHYQQLADQQRLAKISRAMAENRKAQIDPSTMFLNRYPGYQFDELGIPLIDEPGRSKLKKAYEAQKKRHEAWLSHQ